MDPDKYIEPQIIVGYTEKTGFQPKPKRNKIFGWTMWLSIKVASNAKRRALTSQLIKNKIYPADPPG